MLKPSWNLLPKSGVYLILRPGPVPKHNWCSLPLILYSLTTVLLSCTIDSYHKWNWQNRKWNQHMDTPVSHLGPKKSFNKYMNKRRQKPSLCMRVTLEANHLCLFRDHHDILTTISSSNILATIYYGHHWRISHQPVLLMELLATWVVKSKSPKYTFGGFIGHIYPSQCTLSAAKFGPEGR